MLPRVVLCLVCLHLVVGLAPASAQVERGWRCKPLATEYPFLLTDWRWEDANTVTFGVWNGAYFNSASKVDYRWYRYIPSTDTLIKLNESPLNQLKLETATDLVLENVQPGLGGKYENVSISPKRRFIVYPYQKGNQYDTWLLDTSTGAVTALDVGINYTQVVWSENEHYFLLMTPLTPADIRDPVQLVTLTDGVPKVQRFDQVPPLDSLRFLDFVGFKVHGISPDGRYVLTRLFIDSYTTDIFDLQQPQRIARPFVILGSSQVIWETPTRFIALTSLGAIQYDIESEKFEQLATAVELGIDNPHSPDAFFTIEEFNSLSPDGRYMMATRFQPKAGSQPVQQNLVVCKIF
jgi:hypothetical protein